MASNTLAARLNHLAGRTIDRIRDYGLKRPSASSETRQRVEYGEFVKTYEKARACGYVGGLDAWVRYCRDVLEQVKTLARSRAAGWWRHTWDRIACVFKGHRWYDYREGRRICTRCLRGARLIEMTAAGEIWQETPAPRDRGQHG